MEQALVINQFNNMLLQSCSYIVEGKVFFLFDPGESSPLIEFIKNSNKELKAIFLTHCHVDHIYGLGELLKFFPNIPVYCSLSTSDGLFDQEQNLSFLFPDYSFVMPNSLVVNVIKEGEYVINGIKIYVLETPGHSDDCLTYIMGNHIFTGDSYNPNSKVFVKWPKSQKNLAIMNEDKIKRIIKSNNLNVHPGHWQ